MKKQHSEAWYKSKVNYYIYLMSESLTITGRKKAYIILTYYISKLIELTSEEYVVDLYKGE